MRRRIVILVLGVVGAAIAYGCFYLMGTATPRALLRSEQPELAWLKHEFNLSDAEFSRISQLHAGYLPQCRERCRRIDQLNGALSNALDTATQLTPEVEKLLGERAQMRAACQAEMLKHFFEISRTMPPEQGKRYLAWVRENTCLREQAMNHGPENHPEKAMPAHHH
jgi:Heavy-metal resistance